MMWLVALQMSLFILLHACCIAGHLCLQSLEAPGMSLVPKRFHHYWIDLWRAISFSWQQAIAVPTGIHAEFAQYGIDAISIHTLMQPFEVSNLDHSVAHNLSEGLNAKPGQVFEIPVVVIK